MTGAAGYRVLRVPWPVVVAALLVVLLAIPAVTVGRSPWHLVPIVVLGGVGVALEVRRRAVLLRVDEHGLLLRPRSRDPYARPLQVPWSSVARVVVRADDEVGVALLPRSPLPVGVRGVLHDPRDPRAVHPSMVRRVPGLDVGLLRDAVRRATAGRITVEQVRPRRP